MRVWNMQATEKFQASARGIHSNKNWKNVDWTRRARETNVWVTAQFNRQVKRLHCQRDLSALKKVPQIQAYLPRAAKQN